MLIQLAFVILDLPNLLLTIALHCDSIVKVQTSKLLHNCIKSRMNKLH